MPSHPCEIEFVYDHNHGVDCAQFISFRDVDPNTREKILQLYEEKHCTPSLARTEYTEMLRRNAKDLNEFAILHADRSTMPRPSDFNHLYSDYLSSMFGSKNGNDLFEKRDEIVEQFNVQNKEKGGKMKYQVLMKRVVNLQH